jgi:hypothetical protein
MNSPYEALGTDDSFLPEPFSVINPVATIDPVERNVNSTG